MSEVRIITPPGMFGSSAGEEALFTAMRVIGVGFGEEGGRNAKYGTDFENDVFLMKRYCWCERDDCPWCAGCAVYQDANQCAVCGDPSLSLEQRRAAPAEQRCDYSAGRGIFARFAPLSDDRGRHYYDPPNFWFKPDNFRVTWYKYIGRDMVSNKDEVSGDFMERIFATHPRGMTVADAIAETARQEEETSAGFAAIFASLGLEAAPPD